MSKINPYYDMVTQNPKLGSDNLGKDDFLKLLITQLTYQNPLEPMDNRELVAQMAQFSSLEQMQNLNSQMANLSAINAIGKTARAVDQKQQEISGVVKGVTFEKDRSSMILAIGDGDELVEVKIPMENVFELR